MRSLNGAEKLKIFEKINLIDLLPNLDNVENVQKLWSSFFRVYQSLRDGNYEDKEAKADQIQKETREWMELYQGTYQKETITPYIHSFVEHLHELIRIHGDISLFTMQGLICFILLLSFHTHVIICIYIRT